MNQSKHAMEIAGRFKTVYEQSGEKFSDEHLNELQLLIEAGLDAVLLQQLGRIADRVKKLAEDIQNEADFNTTI